MIAPIFLIIGIIKFREIPRVESIFRVFVSGLGLTLN